MEIEIKQAVDLDTKQQFTKLMLGTAVGFLATKFVEAIYMTVLERRNASTND